MALSRVAVVGAGVGGLAAAKAICAALPACGVTVFDSLACPPETSRTDDAPKAGDRALGIWPNGRRVLEHLGAWERLSPLATDIPPAAYRNARGLWLSNAPNNASERVAAARESDIRATLLDRASFECRWGAQVRDVCHNRKVNSVTVCSTSSDGSLCEEDFELVVAADGATSTVRKCIERDAASPTGQVSAAGWLDAEYVREAKLEHTPPFEALSNGLRCAFVPAGGAGAASFFATVDAADSGVDAARLRDIFAGVFEPVPSFFERTCTPLRWDIHFAHTRAVHSASNGVPVCFVGDASFAQPPNLAQGAAAALEDAAVLAKALKQLPLRAALEEYAKRRGWRKGALRRITQFTAAIASANMDGVRDAMALVPHPLNGWVFRAALTHSLGPPLEL